MVVSHDAQKPAISFRVRLAWLYTGLALTFFFLIFVSSSFVYSAHLTRRLVSYNDTRDLNEYQQAKIDDFTKKTKQVYKAIDELVKEDNKLRKMLGMKGWKRQVKLTSNIEERKLSKAQKLNNSLDLAAKKLDGRRESFEQLKDWVSYVRNRYATTPSIWPAYGRIVSRFGYRRRPWKGFHTGLDVAARYGSPVRSTGAGTITYAGWRRGYGRTVMVNHGHGTVTLYGHCSRLRVKLGQRVRKGQVIANIGSTGYSTGPHVHYEVRKHGTPVNPIAYLNLNIFSASKAWK